MTCTGCLYDISDCYCSAPKGILRRCYTVQDFNQPESNGSETSENNKKVIE